MPKFLPLLSLLLLASPAAVRAGSDIDGARRADDERVAATIAADPARLAAVFSDDLTYVHSTGMVNHKADFIKVQSEGSLRYASVVYEVRQFQSAAPGIVLMRGRCRIRTVEHGQSHPNFLGFLAVYRKEGGKWRFLAWQSCKLPADAPPWPK